MIKRYYATKDNTITNAFRESFATSGSDANMGASDILEVFSIYGQVLDENDAYSLEEARILIEFDIADIQADIAAGTLDDSAQFYLRLFNAEHGRTLPFGFNLEVSPLITPWEEGTGLDMESYMDLTYGNGSSWNTANSTFIKATATLPLNSAPNIELTATSTGRGINGRRVQIDVLPDSGADYVVDFTEIGPNGGIDYWTKIDITNPAGGPRITSEEIVAVINTGAIAAKPNLTVNDENNLRTLQTATGGTSTELPDGAPNDLAFGDFSGGEGQWATSGGDYDGTQVVSAFFEEGTEDLVINVTSFVSNWMGDLSSNAGLIIKLPDSVTSEQRSYYTKMFYARGTSNFFKQPVIEARSDSQITDHRKSFLSGVENTVYLYNEVRGQLVDFSQDPTVEFSDETGNLGAATVTREETGIYKATITLSTSSSALVDTWSVEGSEVAQGAITVLSREPSTKPSVSDLVVSTLNNQDVHSAGQTSRFYFYIREKDWSPNIHTVATSRPDSKVYDNLKFKISKVVTDEIIFDYNMTDGSTTLSYDSNGNFFDLDISMLEPNYVYEIKLALFNVMTKSYQELPFKHRFRVVNNEY
jgi:hypothetical protein